MDKTALLTKTLSGKNLKTDEAKGFMDELTDGVLEDSYIAAVLTALSSRPFASEELFGCASVLMKKCRRVKLDDMENSLDIVGTGGDGLQTFNISSLASLLAASCGAKVAKHGNKAVSSRSGSTEFFSALGIPTDYGPEEVARSVKEHGFAYMAAPNFHSAMRHAAPVRAAMRIKTIMNCLGPLVNPASVNYQLMGVYEESLLHIMARAARMMGVKRIWVVHSEDGMDEISSAVPTRIFRIDENGEESDELFNPKSLGISGHNLSDLMGEDGKGNAQMARELLDGAGKKAIRDVICLNAGAALAVVGIVKNIGEGYEVAANALKNGITARKVKALQEQSTPQSFK